MDTKGHLFQQENTSNQIGQMFQKIPNPLFFSGLSIWPGIPSRQSLVFPNHLWPEYFPKCGHPPEVFSQETPLKKVGFSRRKTAFPALGSPVTFCWGELVGRNRGTSAWTLDRWCWQNRDYPIEAPIASWVCGHPGVRGSDRN